VQLVQGDDQCPKRWSINPFNDSETLLRSSRRIEDIEDCTDQALGIHLNLKEAQIWSNAVFSWEIAAPTLQRSDTD